MLYKNVNIESFGYEVPPERISSEEIEARLKPVYERLGLPAGRLELMTGIKERRFWPPGTLPSEAAALAGEKAIASGNIPREKIGCLIMCSVSRDFLEPATATIVHSRLGLSEKAVVFDISNACLGVLTGMTVLANMIELGQVEAGLLVSGENSRPLLESTIDKLLTDKSITRKSIKPLFASLTIGSGSVAVLMSGRKISSSGHSLHGGASYSATRYNDLCRGGNPEKGMQDGAETLMNTDSEMLMKRGVETAFKTWEIFRGNLKIRADDIDCICTHQVGSAHKKLLFEALALDASRDFSTLEYFGNTGSVSCPLTAAIAVEKAAIKAGSYFVLLGIGSGINCTMLGVKW